MKKGFIYKINDTNQLALSTQKGSRGNQDNLMTAAHCVIPYDSSDKQTEGLDLIDRVPGELWMEIDDIVQEAGIKTIPQKKKCKKAKWLSEDALQIAVKRRDMKG